MNKKIFISVSFLTLITTCISCANLELASSCTKRIFDTYFSSNEMTCIYEKTIDGIRVVYSDSRGIQTFINKTLPQMLRELATLKEEAASSITDKLLTFSDEELSELLHTLNHPLYVRLVQTRFAILQEILARTTDKPRLLKAKIKILSASILQTDKFTALEKFFDALIEPLKDATASINTQNIVLEKKWILDRVFAITINVLARMLEFLYKLGRFTRNQLKLLKVCLEKWLHLIYQPFILRVNEQFTQEEVEQLDRLSNHKVMQKMRNTFSDDELEAVLSKATERIRHVIERDPVLKQKTTRLMSFLQECV